MLLNRRFKPGRAERELTPRAQAQIVKALNGERELSSRRRFCRLDRRINFSEVKLFHRRWIYIVNLMDILIAVRFRTQKDKCSRAMRSATRWNIPLLAGDLIAAVRAAAVAANCIGSLEKRNWKAYCSSHLHCPRILGRPCPASICLCCYYGACVLHLLMTWQRRGALQTCELTRFERTRKGWLRFGFEA